MNLIIEKRILIITIGIVLLLLLFADFLTGRNSGGTSTNRASYQIVLLVLTMLLFINYIINIDIKYGPVLKILSLISLSLLIFNFSYFIKGEIVEKLDFLYSVVWIFLFSFGFSIGKSEYATKVFDKFMYALFVFSVFNTLYGLIYFRDTYDIILAPGVYTTLVFYPWLTSQKKSFFNKCCLFVLYIVVLASFKRGAILALFFVTFISSLTDLNFDLRSNKSLKTIAKLFILMVFSILGVYVVNSLSNDFLSKRFSYEEIKDGSGRGDSNSVAIDYILNKSNIEELITGYDLENYFLRDFLGHNDWLVFLINYGIFGFILYLVFYIVLYKRTRFCKRYIEGLYGPYLRLFLLMALISFYSTAFGPTVHPIFIVLSMGIFEGKIKYQNEKN